MNQYHINFVLRLLYRPWSETVKDTTKIQNDTDCDIKHQTEKSMTITDVLQ